MKFSEHLKAIYCRVTSKHVSHYWKLWRAFESFSSFLNSIGKLKYKGSWKFSKALLVNTRMRKGAVVSQKPVSYLCLYSDIFFESFQLPLCSSETFHFSNEKLLKGSESSSKHTFNAILCFGVTRQYISNLLDPGYVKLYQAAFNE